MAFKSKIVDKLIIGLFKIIDNFTMWLWFKKRRVDKLMYWLRKLNIIDKSPVWLSKGEEFSNCSWQSYCMAVTNHWQFSCMALSLKKSLTILLFGFQKSLTIFLYGFEFVNNHWQTSCMAVTNHWQMSMMALSQKVDKITGNSLQNYCNSKSPLNLWEK